MEIIVNSLSTPSIHFSSCSLPKSNRISPKNSLSFLGSKSTRHSQPNCCRCEVGSNAVGKSHHLRSSLESLFCYDKAVPEEIIEEPIGLSLSEKDIGDKPRCPHCLVKGAVLCATCSGSGLYIDSILESQGIIVKVRCLGCGGTGNIMCSECGGRGHLGSHEV